MKVEQLLRAKDRELHKSSIEDSTTVRAQKARETALDSYRAEQAIFTGTFEDYFQAVGFSHATNEPFRPFYSSLIYLSGETQREHLGTGRLMARVEASTRTGTSLYEIGDADVFVVEYSFGDDGQAVKLGANEWRPRAHKTVGHWSETETTSGVISAMNRLKRRQKKAIAEIDELIIAAADPDLNGEELAEQVREHYTDAGQTERLQPRQTLFQRALGAIGIKS